MEWLEITGKTVAEAKDRALDKLGVDDAEAEFEILEEPRQGLFGRTRGEARVRARVRPVTPRPKEDRNRRRRRGKGGGGGGGQQGRAEQPKKNGAGGRTKKTAKKNTRSEEPASAASGEKRGKPKSAAQSGRTAAPAVENEASIDEVASTVEHFLTGLTGAFDLDAPVEISTDNDEVVAHIQGKHGLLLGPKARTLDAIQELTRVTAQRSTPSNIRIKVDVGGYREGRRQALIAFAGKAADRAGEDGVEVVLEPMSSADRKVVHDALAERAGVTTRSAGADPRRRVIVVPDAVADDAPAEPDARADDD